MKTLGSYYMILFVYISLWSCEVIACHLTHSLIILVDSHINLYKVLDISLGILHLKTQLQAKKRSKNSDQNDLLAIRVFDKICTYKFKRLPVLGSFVNGLFLAALLMSAAIEGIQTCFHAKHSADGTNSILLNHPITYPGILVGFALIALGLQWCSNQAHEMREEELESESLLDIRVKPKSFEELNVEKFNNSKDGSNIKLDLAITVDTYDKRNKDCSGSKSEELPELSFLASQRIRRSYESVPTQVNDQSQISLKSLKQAPDLAEDPDFNNIKAISAISSNIKHNSSPQVELIVSKAPKTRDNWYYVRFFGSPIALTTCALIVYFINDELVTEIADASLAISVVILLFAASYPPMKRAGWVLLQSVPDGVDLNQLEASLKAISPLIVEVKNLHVWSLTPRSNRVATCNLLINRSSIESEKHLSELLKEAKLRFLLQNIKCSTIQPTFIDEKPIEES